MSGVEKFLNVKRTNKPSKSSEAPVNKAFLIGAKLTAAVSADVK